MQIFQYQKNTLNNLKEKSFKLEKNMQDLFEQNLEQITRYKFIKSEFIIKSNRIDTLAFDEESKAFVIIEYKRERNDGVVDQGLSYLNLMLEYKGDFIVEYNESCNKNLKRTDVDWSQSKVLFVAPSFNNYQKQSSNFKDLPIELWEIKRFENDIIVINPIKKSKSAPSFKEVQGKEQSTISKVVKEIKVHTEEDRLFGKSEEIKELYESFKNAILNLDDKIEVSPKKLYISFIKDNHIILDIVVQKEQLRLYINQKNIKIEDSKKLGTTVNDNTKWGYGYLSIVAPDTKNLEYIMSLVKQAL